jgi:uncharacterized protein YxeA
MDLILSVVFLEDRPGVAILMVLLGFGLILFLWPKDSYDNEEIYVSTLQKESQEPSENDSTDRT